MASALAGAGAAGQTVRVRGGGTKDHLGDLRATDIVISTAGLAGVVDHVPADLTVTFAAGTRMSDAQRALGERGQFLPLDPPHVAAGATIGGIVAANSNGFGRLRYGGVRDLLIGAAIALADGTVARSGGRVVKNVSGYDLNKLFTGSLGTLGVIVEATFKILPVPPARSATVVRDISAADAFARADAIVRTSLRPSALVVHQTRELVELIVAAQGDRPAVERTMRDAGGERTDDPDSLLGPLRELPGTATEGLLVRAALPLGAQRAFAETARAVEGFTRLVADAGSGIVRVHLTGEDDVITGSADALVAAAHVVGGGARVERRAPRLTERLSAWAGSEPSGLFLMRRVKEAFDPSSILEPGRSAIG
jgi:glycolate oxidase FAD binding subunit